MHNFKNIQVKLEAFIRKYYTNELIKGTILFFSIGLLYFLLTLLIEHFLWLSSSGRTILFWLFVVVEMLLFAKFIAIPLAKLFKLKKGINYEEASQIIGNHFPEVNDKLLNVLQLKQSSEPSELLLASIAQKSASLQPVPFKLAVNFKKNTKYLKYAAIPVLILLLASVSGHFNWFSDSYKRVVNYKTAYEPPAPFQFFVINENLQATENKDFTLFIKTVGEVQPENVQITYNNETYFLQQKAIGDFEYVISKPKQNLTFQLLANNVTSKPYTLQVIEAPTLLSFDMVLEYPSHTKKQDETLKSTGNAIVPQGTNITWKLNTKATDQVHLYAKDTLVFTDNSGVFTASKKVYNNLKYNLTTSNANLKDYENLAFSIDVIKDEYPELNIKMKVDSLDQQSLYFYGQVSDDYGLHTLQLVYYPSENEAEKRVENITISKSNVADFITAFPNNLEITEGISYDLYFQVFDNDVIHKYKSTKSEVFSYRKLTQEEEEQKQLQEQKETIQELNKSLEKMEERDKELEQLSKNQKEKSTLSFNDKRKLDNFLKRQKEQEEMMKSFNKKLKDNLEEFQQEKEDDPFKDDLKQRLKENEEQLQKDEKLLEELEKLREKLDKEELSEKLEKLAKQNKNQERSLEQLLELTKKYYVAKKLEKLQQELEKLADKQEKLSEEIPEKNTKEKQDEINKEFENFQKEMDALEKENQELKRPEKIDRNKKEEENVKEDQQEASDKLEEKQNSQEEQQKQSSQKQAQQKQKQAAQKMKQMSAQMQAAMASSSGEQLAEDVAMLRQVLDNLVLFSFDQEHLMKQFNSIEVNHNKYASYLRKQYDLREHFSHIDDSLFALSLRQPKISEKVNKEIGEVFYNVDKSLEEFSENQIYKGVSNQQYTITSANNLADFLSNALDNMQMQMSGQGQGGQGQPKPGEGEGGEGGLPDIIKSQEQLAKEMEGKMGDGKKGEAGEGNKGQQGENGKEKGEGKNGNDGEGETKLGEGNSEELHGELFRIYQQQQQIRQALQDRLAKEGKGGIGSNLVKQMEQIELDLLNKGFTKQTLQKMMNLKHQLLKLEQATLQQGQEEKRESQNNTKNFDNKTNNKIPTAKQYFNTTEILNRQSLPLQSIYKKKVQEYFKQNND
ncbi:hypothetical protein KO494_00625 [Lacinutrix sp. C3R15]|uniref:DUF4175 family protein n=1 Tax=Flavobacteriaceae TaxID=49546 RepID=UPI001C0A009D|nr:MULTISPECIES: DUF4175 family protein [Flavobacteriaceae]MBU2938029.1 hypothetical protein [Lacinutrix sp. C3R15]MDO6621343.1 hypothetical protein [Oceanihabitans sp. 1_MG-2023]